MTTKMFSLHKTYISLFENLPGYGFLGAQSFSSNGAETYSPIIADIAHISLFSDLLLYISVLVMIFFVGAKYNTEHRKITDSLVQVAGFFCYTSLVINLFVVCAYYETLSSLSVHIFSGLYVFTISTQILKIALLLVSGALYTLFPTQPEPTFRTLELPLLMQITLALSITILSANNLALILLSLEGFSLTLYIMTALGRTYGGITASVKYFAFGTLGSIFLFWGVVHIYAIVPTLQLSLIKILFSAADSSHQYALDFATTAISFGFMLKLGAAPTHQWVADTYAGVHFYITAYFSIFVKCILFLVFFRTALNFNCDSLVTQFAVLSLIIGCFMSINQTEVKRLLAYSSIVHVGFLLMGDAGSSLVYLLTYVVSSLVIFSVLLNTRLAGKELIYLNDLRYVRKSGSFAVFSMVTALASSAGLPPFAGFYGKFLVWTSLIEDIYLTNSLAAYFTLFVSVTITLVTIFYYMRVIAYLFIGHDEQIQGASVEFSFSEFYLSIFSAQGLLTALLIFWSFFQSYALSVSQLIILGL